MAIKKFLTSVADAYGYDESNNLLFVGKTLLDTSIETALNATDVRAGKGAPLQYVFYNSPDLNVTISDSQWNLAFLAQTVGADVVTGNNVYKEENVTLTGGGAGTVTGTPVAVTGTTIYGWVTLVSGVTEKVAFTGSNFTCSGTSGDVVCVRYYYYNAASTSLTIKSSMIPKIVRLVLIAQLNSSDVSTNLIGEVQIVIPRASMTGSFQISLTPDGVSSTPLSARALQTTETGGGCTNEPYLAKIYEIITSAHWYDGVLGISISGGDFALTHPATKQLVVYAIPATGAAFVPPTADLTFSSGTVGTATISAGGLVTTVASGSSLLKASITAVPTIDANVVVTVS